MKKQKRNLNQENKLFNFLLGISITLMIFFIVFSIYFLISLVNNKSISLTKFYFIELVCLAISFTLARVINHIKDKKDK